MIYVFYLSFSFFWSKIDFKQFKENRRTLDSANYEIAHNDVTDEDQDDDDDDDDDNNDDPGVARRALAMFRGVSGRVRTKLTRKGVR